MMVVLAYSFFVFFFIFSFCQDDNLHFKLVSTSRMLPSRFSADLTLILFLLVPIPSGKADTLSETAFETARREACEEIGLAGIHQPLPAPFSVEHLCELPANLAKTELVVRPCVALLHSFDPATGINADPETELIPRLDAREVAAVFTARFDDFLRLQNSEGRGEGDWYKGSWSLWHNSNWRSKCILGCSPLVEIQVFFVFFGEIRKGQREERSLSLGTCLIFPFACPGHIPLPLGLISR